MATATGPAQRIKRLARDETRSGRGAHRDGGAPDGFGFGHPRHQFPPRASTPSSASCPILGDLLSQAIPTYIIWEARRLGVSNFTLARMVGNTLIDTVFGAVPIVGDAFDVAFRANMKNLRLLQQHLEKNGMRPAGPGPIIEGDYRRVA